MSTLDALRSSSKGQLQYDRFWLPEGTANGMLKRVVSEATSYSIPEHLVAGLYQSQPSIFQHGFYISSQHVIPITGNSKTHLVTQPNSNPKLQQLEPHPNFESLLQISKIAHADSASVAGTQWSSSSGTSSPESRPNPQPNVDIQILEYEKQRELENHMVVEDKRAVYEQFHNKMMASCHHEYMMLKKCREMELLQQNAQLQQEEEMRRQEMQLQERKLQEQQINQVKNISHRLKEVELKKRQIEQEVMERARIAKSKFEVLFAAGSSLTQHILTVIRSCNSPQSLGSKIPDIMSRIAETTSCLRMMKEQCIHRDVLEADILCAEQCKSQLQSYYILIQKAVEVANAKAEEVARAEETARQKEEDSKRQEVAQAVSQVDGGGDQLDNQLSSQLEQCIPGDVLKSYTVRLENLVKVQQSYQDLVTNQTFKKTKFDLQKATNTPLNAISATSGSHLMDKLDKLRRLLAGQTVEIGDKRISSSSHPQSHNYCAELLANKFVKQGEEQIASKNESAFPIAAVVVGLWTEFPDFGELLLAHLHIKCPYLVPYYVPREEDQSESEHYRAQGYLYNEGVVEKQDKFLKRMSGIVRLYAAILVSPLPPGSKGQHPLTIENGWYWMVRIIKLAPRLDITATILYHFLAVAGHTLQQTYGRQFNKLLLTLCKEYFPLLRNVTPDGSGGPLARLELFLQTCIKQGQIPKPDGFLSPHFFNT